MDKIIAQRRFFLHQLIQLVNDIKDSLHSGKCDLAYEYACEILTILSNKLELSENIAIYDNIHDLIDYQIQNTKLYESAYWLRIFTYHRLYYNQNYTKEMLNSNGITMTCIYHHAEKIRSMAYMLDFIYYIHQDDHRMARFTTLVSRGYLPYDLITPGKLIPSFTYNCRGLSIFQPMQSENIEISCLHGLYDLIEFIGCHNLPTLSAILFSNEDECHQTASFHLFINALMMQKNDEQKKLLPDPLLFNVLEQKLKEYKQQVNEIVMPSSRSREENISPDTPTSDRSPEDLSKPMASMGP